MNNLVYADKNYCVYAIKNKNTSKKYIGSTMEYEKRLNRHFSELRGGKHHSIYLQRSFDKHGEDAFTHCILHDNMTKDEAHQLEEQIISDGYGGLYNVSKYASGGDLISYHPNLEKIREVHRENSIKRWEDDRCDDGWTEIKTGEKNGMYGKTHTEETRQKISQAHTGRIHTEEARQNMSNAHKERYKDPKEREKVSQGLHKRYGNPEERRKTGEATQKRFEDPKEREKYSKLSKEVWQRPGHREKMMEIARENGEKIKAEFIYKGVKYRGITESTETLGISRHTLANMLLSSEHLDCYYITEPQLKSDNSKQKYKEKQHLLSKIKG